MPTSLFSGLSTAAFDGTGHPEALVYVPERLDPARFGLVVYLHGFDNCIENVAAAEPGIHDPPHPTANLIEQLEASGKSAILFLPETRHHARSNDPGRLGEAGGFARLWHEVHTRLCAEQPVLLATRYDTVSPIVLISHSGGFRAAARIADRGGLPIQELCLLDSLYGDLELYESIAAEHIATLPHPAGQRPRRLINLYRGDGTGKHARAQAAHIRRLLEQKGLPPELLLFDDSDGDTAAEVLSQQLARPLVVKRVGTEHSDFGRSYVEALLRTSALPDGL